MGRDPTQNETPDLFSTQADPSPKQAEGALTRRPFRRPALPKDLPKSIQYLDDAELDWLLRTAIQEAKRRARPLPVRQAASTDISSKPPRSPEKPTRQRQIGPATGLTQGQINAVQAAFKAGVAPRRIARKFGLTASKSAMRFATAAGETTRR